MDFVEIINLAHLMFKNQLITKKPETGW